MDSRPPQLVAFGTTLRRMRRERELSQEALGLRAGVATKHISELECGRRDPRLTTVMKLGSALTLRDDEVLALWRMLLRAA
jgi:transcriptional regulator with XRE-family HTH domain